jgi:hypothetical protein
MGVMLFAVIASFAMSAQRAVADDAQCHTTPKIYVLRGAFEVFSLGMNDLAAKLRNCGYDATATSWSVALLGGDCSDDRPLVVIGHSLGGKACAWLPQGLARCGRRVPLLIILDSNLLQRIPCNVDRCVNIYHTNSLGVFHGTPVEAESDDTEVVNWNLTEDPPECAHGWLTHFNIDATDWVHQLIIDEIANSFPRPACCCADCLREQNTSVVDASPSSDSSPSISSTYSLSCPDSPSGDEDECQIR